MPARTALWLCATALALGLLGDQLLRSSSWGAGPALWLVLSIGTALGVARLARPAGFPALAALLLTGAFFAACLAWRDAEGLNAWNVFSVMVALTLGLPALVGLRLRAAGAFDYAREAAGAGFRAAVAPILFAVDLLDREAGQQESRRRMRAVAVGVVVTIPIIVLFGALLVSADPVFERLARFLIGWDLERLVSHLVVTSLLTWLAAGYLRGVVAHDTGHPLARVTLPSPRWGAIETGVPLGALAALFLTFVVVQARYLFGGDDLVRTAVGLTYAEYARRGFFELVAVAGLVLPLLMGAAWVVREGDRGTTRTFRALGTVILVLVGLIMLSAATRLRLYRDAYGLTEDRLYAAAVLAWIALTLAWFGGTVLRGRGQRFMLGAVVAGFATVAAMNVLNPDAVIARTNLARAARGAELDTAYLSLLSADATPVLVAAVDGLSLTHRCAIARSLVADERQRQEGDWRSWSVGRARADRAVRDLASVLSACPAAPAVSAAEGGAPGH